MVDDDEAVRDSLRRTLVFEGYHVVTAADGAQALAALVADRPDLVVLDVQMPVLDGMATVRRMRADGEQVPVLMLTARDGTSDRVTGLDVGADDYLAKPFALEELLARVRALLRRARVRAEDDQRLSFADLMMSTTTREVTRAGRPIELTPTEHSLLELFLLHPRQVLTREQILREVWGFEHDPMSNTLDVYVGYLRRKLEADGRPRLLHTVRGIGFVLRSAPADGL